MLRGIVLPHSIAFGYLIEGLELAVGIALLSGVLLLLAPPRPSGAAQSRLAAVEMGAVVVAAVVGTLLCINFHFLMGDGLFPTINPARPFDEGIDLDTLLPPLSLIVAITNATMIEGLPQRLARLWPAAARSAVQLSDVGGHEGTAR